MKSKLSDHQRRDGKLVPPFLQHFGSQLVLQSWARTRLPEYLWLGLILNELDRKVGMETCMQILHYMHESLPTLQMPKLSEILALPENDQRTVYDIISAFADRLYLAPLTCIYGREEYPIFYDAFNRKHLPFEHRLQTLAKCIGIFSPHQSNEATDLRYMPVFFLLNAGRMKFFKGTEETIESLKEYPYTPHNESCMGKHRTTVRATELGGAYYEPNYEFANFFWKEVGLMTTCKPVYLEWEETPEALDSLIEDIRTCLSDLVSDNKEEALFDPKFEVMTGSVCYVLKIVREIVKHELTRSIIARQSVRVVLEVFMVLKYLLKNAESKPAIWNEYKQYGIGKYKLVLLKAREFGTDKVGHIKESILNYIVNEDKMEEFQDTDFSYFDKQKIRDKFNDVGEKLLFDVAYDYDSSYAHGLWGAVRESAMVRCNNEAHQDHRLPDLGFKQKLPSVARDCRVTLLGCMELLKNEFGISSWFVDKYLVENNET